MNENNNQSRHRPRWRWPLRYFIALVIFIAMLPPVIVVTFTLLRISDADREATERRFVDNAELIAGMVESAVNAHASMIQSLAAAQDMTRLAPVAEHFNGSIQITTPSAPLEQTTWQLGNLFEIVEGQSARVRMTIPLEDSNQQISLIADAKALTKNIDITAGAGSSLLVAVVDGNGKVVTRSTQTDSFIGLRVPTWDALLNVGADRGLFDAETIEGEMITFGFSKIHNTDGWAVVIGLPKSILQARWQEPLLVLIAGILITILATVAISSWVATLIVAPVTGLVQRARAILRNEGTLGESLSPTPIAELDELLASQRKAHEALLERAQQLSISNRRYRAIAEVGTLGTWRRCIDGTYLEVTGWEALTGKSWAEDPMAQTRFHPDDADEIDEIWNAKRHVADTLELEFRVLSENDTYVWVRSRGASIRNDAGEVVEWIGTFENIDEQMREHLHVRHLAYHDSLTGLPNRTRLEDHMTRAWKERDVGLESALLYVDLDRFKQANDNYGHALGDELLKHVARRLQRLTRPSDIVARIGGDEFAIVLHDIRDTSVAQLVGLRIVKSLAQTYDINGNAIEIGASVGISILNLATHDIPTWMKEADSALYSAKTAGRNRSIIFGEAQPKDKQRI